VGSSGTDSSQAHKRTKIRDLCESANEASSHGIGQSSWSGAGLRSLQIPSETVWSCSERFGYTANPVPNVWSSTRH
jgi:hypothetical protein